jgi:hypothetical protein
VYHARLGIFHKTVSNRIPRGKHLGMRPLIAHGLLAVDELYRRTGKRQPAQEHLTTVSTMYCEMDMQFWLEQAEVRNLA